MKSTLYVGMAIIFLSFIGFVGIVALAGLVMSTAVATGNPHTTWAAFKERLPTFLALAGFVVIVGLLLYGAVLIIQYYGA
jgi:hypothetical protein